MEKDMLLRSRGITGLWKPAVVCLALLMLIVGNVQAVESDAYDQDQNADIYAEAVALQLNTNYRWIHSGRELFYTRVGGQTRFVGIQAMMRVPFKVETSRYYSIPVYFTRFTPQLCVSVAQESVRIPVEPENISRKHALQVKPVLPIDVFMCAGIGKHSYKNSCNLPGGFFHIGIRVCDGNMWNHEMPIVRVRPTASSENSKQHFYAGFSQKIWIRQPEYKYLTDIPVGVWDGPYMINVKIDVISYLPPSIVPPPKENIPPPIPPVEIHVESKATPIPKKAVQIVSAVDEDDEVSVLSEYARKSDFKFIKTVELKEAGGNQVYQVKGVRRAKLLGVIPVEMDVTVNIDIETGSIETVERPWWGFLAS